jgi:hypothetical protein
MLAVPSAAASAMNQTTGVDRTTERASEMTSACMTTTLGRQLTATLAENGHDGGADENGATRAAGAALVVDDDVRALPPHPGTPFVSSTPTPASPGGGTPSRRTRRVRNVDQLLIADSDGDQTTDAGHDSEREADCHKAR